MKFISGNLFKIFLIILVLIALYVLSIYLLKDPLLNKNEFGDYIGGILNPAFALISTAAIIYLTLTIAKAEKNKADESIETQKRITLNQMRHDALNNLIEKLNSFVYQLDKLNVTEGFKYPLVKKIIENDLKKEYSAKGGEKPATFWFIVLLELESFAQKTYLFQDLFDSETYNKIYNDLTEITSKIADDHNATEMMTQKHLGEYLKLKHNLTNQIGSYIIQKF